MFTISAVFYEQLEQGQAGNFSRGDALAVKLAEVQLEANALAVPNAFGRLLQRAGGVGLNAGCLSSFTLLERLLSSRSGNCQSDVVAIRPRLVTLMLLAASLEIASRTTWCRTRNDYSRPVLALARPTSNNEHST